MLRFRLPLALLVVSLLASTASAAPVFSRLGPSGQRTFAAARATEGVVLPTDDGAVLMSVDTDAMRDFRTAGGGVLTLPTATGGTLDLELERYDVMGPGTNVTYTDATGRHAFVPDVTLFRGHVAGDTTSWVVLSMSGAGVLGTIEQRGHRLMLTPAQGFAPEGSTSVGVHALAPEDEASIAAVAARWECGINADNEHAYGLTERPLGMEVPRRMATPDAVQLNTTRMNFTAGVDCDLEVYSTKFASNLTAATAYVMTLLGTVNLVYERDLEATILWNYVNRCSPPSRL